MFEGRRHMASLYFKDLYVGDASVYDISPSGKYALYIDYERDAQIMLFSATNKSKRQVTPKFVGLPREYLWNEAKKYVRITFYDGKPALGIALD